MIANDWRGSRSARNVSKLKFAEEIGWLAGIVFIRQNMRYIISTIGLILLLTTPAWGSIDLEVVTIGFPSDGSVKWLYRGGAFAPVGVRLTLKGESARTVYLRVEQFDGDGDIVYTDKMIALTPDQEGVVRTHWVYYVPNPETGVRAQGLTLQLLDESSEAVAVNYDGQTVRRVVVPDMPEVIEDEQMIILSIGEGTAGKIRALSDAKAPEDSKFNRPVRVAHISPDLIPDHWHGLEMVDAIVWEAANPSTLSPVQMEAMRQWVHFGGRLFIAAGETSDLLAKSELQELLPVKMSGVRPAVALPRRLLDGNWRLQNAEEVTVPQPIAMTQCQPAAEARALVQSVAKTQTYLAKRSYGRGQVVFLACTLRDLFQVPNSDPVNFFQKVLQLRDNFKIQENDFGQFNLLERVDLPAYLLEPISFQVATTKRMFIAILFVIIYGLSATWGSWLVLRSRQQLKHSWSAFFVVAAAASIISLLAVRALQGIGRQLHQVTIVDATVDSYAAEAFCYFGIKSSTFEDRFDLWLPDNPPASEAPERGYNYLRPLSPRLGLPTASFTDTQRYPARTTSAALDDVPIRATLKQFEGYWRGQLPGQLHANLRRALKDTGGLLELAPDSTITNQLGVDLEYCFLLHFRNEADVVDWSRNTQAWVYPLGTLADQQVLNVQQLINIDPTTRLPYQQQQLQERFEAFKLQNVQEKWRDSFRRGGSFWNNPFENIPDMLRSVLMLSSMIEYQPVASQNEYMGPRPITFTYGRWLDRSLNLGPDKVLLIGFTREPSRALLQYRLDDGKYQQMQPRDGGTIYRIVIPLQAAAASAGGS
ncbi:MAG: hypothetical protein HJJLKODD_00328 [Phycisphaerae bacterium]|nr:hypothetical protein [Phycisphaerae bacterium]